MNLLSVITYFIGVCWFCLALQRHMICLTIDILKKFNIIALTFPFKEMLSSIKMFSRRSNIITVRLRHKINKEVSEKRDPKVAADVMNYLNFPEYRDIVDKLPKALLRKYKSPENMYLINRTTAKYIANTVNEYLVGDSPIIEVNPGLGFLSRELLQNQDKNIYIYEMLNHFIPSLNQLQTEYPGRVTYKVADFFGMWKLAFQDKMDQGNRIEELLGDLTTNDDDRSVKIIGSMPGLLFLKHLINNIIFHNTTNKLGVPDLFITMPAHNYEFLTDGAIQLTKQKSLPMLFQLLFNCKVLSTLPKLHFLPWTNQTKGNIDTTTDDYSLHLVNITRKEKLPCASEYLPLLWYFFKPQVFSKTTRVIPLLEQWIPGCGIWLITGQDPPDTNRALSPGPDDEALPHMTIFTQFGDLNLRQKLTVFKRFISWPEFEHCQFRLTMESNLPRFVTGLEEDKDALPTHLHDMDETDGEHET